MAKKKWLRSPTRPDVGADADIPMEEGEALIAKQGEVLVASKGGVGCYISSRLNIFSSGDLVTEKKKKPLRSPSRPPSNLQLRGKKQKRLCSPSRPPSWLSAAEEVEVQVSSLRKRLAQLIGD